MGDKTGIEWTDATWNPIVGCSILSPGCTNCYAMKMAARIERMDAALGHVPHYRGLTRATKAGPIWTGKLARASDLVLSQPMRWRRPRRIFVNSMSDLFHEEVPDRWIDAVFAIMAMCPQHVFQVLTKRADRMRRYMAPFDQRRADGLGERVMHLGYDGPLEGLQWPLPNVWLGVSTEDQARADERIPHLLATPAAKRFISAEPLLGPIDLDSAWHGEDALSAECWGSCAWCDKGYPPLHNCRRHDSMYEQRGRSGLDWVIVGGESGPDARPMHPQWVRTLRDQCKWAEVPLFFKQWGSWRPPLDGEAFDTSKGRAGSPPAFIVGYDGNVHCFSGDHVADGVVMVGSSKSAAGAQLDGVAHRAMPA